MIHHLVWFKLKEDISPEEKEELKANMIAMKPLIPQIVSMACGEDFSGRARGFGWGLAIQFNNREDGQDYDKHPDHQDFIAKSKHLWTQVQALDFEE